MTLQIKLPIHAVEYNKGGHAEALVSLLQFKTPTCTKASNAHARASAATLEYLTCDIMDGFNFAKLPGRLKCILGLS